MCQSHNKLFYIHVFDLFRLFSPCILEIGEVVPKGKRHNAVSISPLKVQ